LGSNAAKEKLEIVSGAAPRLRRGFGGQVPPFRIFAGGFPRPSTSSGRNAEGAEERKRRSTFGLIQEYCNTLFSYI